MFLISLLLTRPSGPSFRVGLSRTPAVPSEVIIVDNLSLCLQSQLKDVFDIPVIDKTKWSLVQGGAIQGPCSTLVEETAKAIIIDLSLSVYSLS